MMPEIALQLADKIWLIGATIRQSEGAKKKITTKKIIMTRKKKTILSYP